jgi:ABC-2 type transport system ATP-binding protein
MTVGRFLTFVAQLRGVPRDQAPARVDEAEEKTATRQVHDQLIGSLSHGFRQRVGVAQALVHRPKLLILDEPTSGLDPVQIIEMRSTIRNLRGDHTILLSSHILSEISQTCDRLLVIQDGEIVAQGSEQELATRMGAGGIVEVEIAGPARRAVDLVSAIPNVGHVTVLREADGVSAIRLQASPELRPKIARTLVQGGVDLLRMDRGAAQLESIFLRLTQNPQDRDAASSASSAPSSKNASSELPQ